MSKQNSSPPRAVAYLRVSSREQGDSGLGLESQEQAIYEAAGRRGWEIVHIYKDVASGKSRNGRPGLAAALERLRTGGADVLVAAKLDRLARSTLNFAELAEASQAEGWALVVLSPDIDLSTSTGRMLAGVLASLAQWERELIGERTTGALAVAKGNGKRLGLPQKNRIPAEVAARIVEMRCDGMSYRGIATKLTEEGVPTALAKRSGGRWAAETVRQAHLAAL